MQPDALRAFVVEAHRNGYSAAEPEIDTDGLQTIEFEHDGWGYVDRWVAGNSDFIGFEVVTEDDAFVWGMNYYGYLTDPLIDGEPIYDFLTEALQQVSTDHPFRGPPLARDGLEYSIETTGDIGRFHGTETIRQDGEAVYAGFFRGGLIE